MKSCKEIEAKYTGLNSMDTLDIQSNWKMYRTKVQKMKKTIFWVCVRTCKWK